MMLLTALYEYAQRKRLLDELPIQTRVIHALISIGNDGSLRHEHLIPLMQPDERGKERPGQERRMPRFPGENNGGRAYFLAEGTVGLLGRHKVTGTAVWADADKAPKAEKNAAKAFAHFWEQIQEAQEATKDARLGAILAFKAKYLRTENARVASDLPFLTVRANKNGKPEFVGKAGLGADDSLLLKQVTLGFQVDGQPMTFDDEQDSLRGYWFSEYTRQALPDDADAADDKGKSAGREVGSLCLVTGRTGEVTARSHKPKILGVPGLSSGGYIVSFARAAPAFSSYGFEMGQNAPVCETAAAGYALAVNDLLSSENTSVRLGPTAVCFWAKRTALVGHKMSSLLNKAYPEQVREFFRAPFAGEADADAIKQDRFYTIALTGNAGRVVIQHWIDQPLAEAVEHFRQWYEDLQIVRLFGGDVKEAAGKPARANRPADALAVPNLARATLKRSKSQKDDRLVGDRIVQLYRAALEGASPPLSLLSPILDEFCGALLKNDESDPKKRTYPYSLSRFALIKLILTRHFRQRGEDKRKGAFMPSVELAETRNSAYNCGRLLAVLEALQRRSSSTGRENGGGNRREGPKAGVVERYYGRASTAPAQVLPLLLKLSRHHLSKLQKGTEPDRRAASALERRKIDVLANLVADPGIPGSAPTFPGLLNIEDQGIFALGFYQQKAYDIEQYRRFKATGGKEGEDVADDEQESSEAQG